MISNQQKNGLASTMCICFCIALIFGIVWFVYYEKSFLDIQHECEIYYIHTSLCTYACGTVCSRRLNMDNDTDKSPQDLSSSHTTHCHTKYCWGLQYVYEWKTMDWKYHPFKVQTKLFEKSIMDEHKLHGYIESPFVNITKQTEQKLKALLKYINDKNNNIELSHDEILNIDLEKYITQITNNNNIAEFMEWHFLEWNTETTIQPITMSTTLNPYNVSNRNTTFNPYDVNWCDWKLPAYNSYGICSSWPIQWYSLGDSETCWTNNKCNFWSTISPITSWHLAKGFGYTAIACFGVFVLVILYWCTCWCCGKLCGYSSYQRY
eukprot:344552_1